MRASGRPRRPVKCVNVKPVKPVNTTESIYGASPMRTLVTGLAVGVIVAIPIGLSFGRKYQRHSDGWARLRAHRKATRGIRRRAIGATRELFGTAALAAAVVAFGLFLLLTKGH